VSGARLLLLLADTHVPTRARDLPAEVWAQVERVDAVLHAGDWVDVELLDAMERRSRRLVGVAGNNDGPALRARLPELARVELGGLRFAVVHETGPAAGRERRCAESYADADVLVFGHSHVPWDTTTATGLRLLNPGSPTDRRRQPYRTYLTATADRGVRATLRRTEDTCLVESIVLQRWYAAHGEPRDLIVGVSDPTDEFRAHAWLDGEEPPADGPFHELLRRPAPGG